MTTLRSGDPLGASYRLGDPIGAGAAGEVWTALPAAGGEVLAAKILRAEHAGDPRLVERFVRERSVLLGLQHENVVGIRDLVVEGGTLAILMEYVEGGSLRDLLDTAGPLPPTDALDICAQVLRALAAAHAGGVTHRDIKPDNVLLTRPWRPGDRATIRVSDFGIADVLDGPGRTTTGVLGTPEYLAPELIAQGRIEPAGDVYAAGILLYELLAGRTPFSGPGTEFSVAYRHVTSTPPTLPVPDSLADALDRLLAKNPSERPAAADAAAALDRLAREHSGAPALPRAIDPETFAKSERQATVLRRDDSSSRELPAEVIVPVQGRAPALGEPESPTVVRRLHVSAPPRIPAPPPTAGPKRPAWLTRRVVVLAAVATVVLLGAGIWIALAVAGARPHDPGSTERLTATQQDQPLPTGLGTSREATFDPATDRVTLKLTLSAQKAPLNGDFFTSIPPVSDDSPCPKVEWEGASGAPHQGSVTGITGPCGWSLSGIEVPAEGEVTVTGSFSGSPKDAATLNAWLGRAADETNATITDPVAVSTAYPAQRIRGVQVRVPSRAVSQTPLSVVLIPMWPGGADELNPLFKSPSTGEASQMLTDIAGATDPVRFDDGCSGALAVAKDGTTVTVLTVASDCRLRASVGNFTGLESNAFSVTTRG